MENLNVKFEECLNRLTDIIKDLKIDDMETELVEEDFHIFFGERSKVIKFIDGYVDELQYIITDTTPETIKKVLSSMLYSRVYHTTDKEWAKESYELEGDMLLDESGRIAHVIIDIFGNEYLLKIIKSVILMDLDHGNKLHPNSVIVQWYYSLLHTGKLTHDYDLLSNN